MLTDVDNIYDLSASESASLSQMSYNLYILSTTFLFSLYLRQGGYVLTGVCQCVCLSVF